MAASQLIKSGQNIDITFIGEGPSRLELQKLADTQGISEYIHFLGKKDRDFVYSELCKYDLMCHPARYEGFGLVVAEAIAAGVPVLVSNSGGPFEIIQQGKYGLYFENGNIDSLIHELRRFINLSSDIVEKKSIEAKNHVEEVYSIKNIIDKLNIFYKKNNKYENFI